MYHICFILKKHIFYPLRHYQSARSNPLSTKVFNLNFHPLEVVSRLRDPQLQVSENYSYLTKCRLMVDILPTCVLRQTLNRDTLTGHIRHRPLPRR